MKSIFLASLTATLLCASGSAQAADFIFEFNSDLSDPDVNNAVAGTVTGRILGLPDDGTGSAMQIFIDSFSPDATLPFPIDATSWFWQFENSFTVSGGMITSAIFHADDFFGQDRLYINVPIYDTGGTNYASLGSNNEVSVWNNQGLNGIAFTRIENVVPELSTWAMVLIGFGATGFAMRRAKAAKSSAPQLA